MPEEQWPQIVSGKPACYRIAVQGCLDVKKRSGRLGGMQFAIRSEDDEQAVTILTGPVKDQAELIGVVNALYQMRMNILSVNCESTTD